MVRPLDTATMREQSAPTRRVANSTGRVVGAALACLLVTSVVVERSVAAIQPWDTSAGTAFSAASIELADDDRGRSLVDLENMVPGRSHSSCINVHYNGSVLPVELTMTAEVVGELADFVTVRVAQGVNGSFDDCETFEETTEVFRGSLAQLNAEPIAVGTFRGTDETIGYRFEYDMIDSAEAIAKSASADIVWEATPS